MENNILEQLRQIRSMYLSVENPDSQLAERYAWIITKGIKQHGAELGGLTCRQLLADAMKMYVGEQPLLQRPSRLYSQLLRSAMVVAEKFPEFHFVNFLNHWNPSQWLMPEDYEKVTVEKFNPQNPNMPLVQSYLPLAERVTKASLQAMLMRPQEMPATFQLPLQGAEGWYGYHPVMQMVVTQVTMSEVRGRRMYFARLASASGEEVMAGTHLLRPNPLLAGNSAGNSVGNGAPARHYVNIGQVYNVLLRDRQKDENADNAQSSLRLVDAMLSESTLPEIFDVVEGYVEKIDSAHNHIHIYDCWSRHFVCAYQRFVNAREGEMVTFVPIVPLHSKFKSAIIVPQSQLKAPASAFLRREIKVTRIDEEKGYCMWELVDKSNPVSEQLSPLQLSEGLTSEEHTTGFARLDEVRSLCSSLAVGTLLTALIYLRRGKDGKKRPVLRKISV